MVHVCHWLTPRVDPQADHGDMSGENKEMEWETKTRLFQNQWKWGGKIHNVIETMTNVQDTI